MSQSPKLKPENSRAMWQGITLSDVLKQWAPIFERLSGDYPFHHRFEKHIMRFSVDEKDATLKGLKLQDCEVMMCALIRGSIYGSSHHFVELKINDNLYCTIHVSQNQHDCHGHVHDEYTIKLPTSKECLKQWLDISFAKEANILSWPQICCGHAFGCQADPLETEIIFAYKLDKTVRKYVKPWWQD
jgi:hypothetical protein